MAASTGMDFLINKVYLELVLVFNFVWICKTGGSAFKVLQAVINLKIALSWLDY